MIPVARWTTRTFNHELPVELFAAVLERLRGTPVRAAELLGTAAEPLQVWRPSGAWSARQHIGHLDDLHDLDMRRIDDFLSGAATLTAADLTNRKTHDADHNRTATGALVERLRLHREHLVGRLEALAEADAADEVIGARQAVHPRLQRPLRMIDWMYFVAEHDDHHLASARAVLHAAGLNRRDR